MENQTWLVGPLPEVKWEPWGRRTLERGGWGSADGVSDVGDLNILAALVVAAQLKHQCPHVAAQLSLRHTAYDLRHPGGRGAKCQEAESESSEEGQLGGGPGGEQEWDSCQLRLPVTQLTADPTVP